MNMQYTDPDKALPADSIDPRLLSLAMAFVPAQSFETPYEPSLALSRGTIFPSLDKATNTKVNTTQNKFTFISSSDTTIDWIKTFAIALRSAMLYFDHAFTQSDKFRFE